MGEDNTLTGNYILDGRSTKDEITIISMNGINSSILASFVYKEIIKRGIDCTTIDACSAFINKTEHIDSILKANLNIEQLKYIQLYSKLIALEKFIDENIYCIDSSKKAIIDKYIYSQKAKTTVNEKETCITDALYNAKNAVILYSSGAHDLMRILNSDPHSIIKDYKSYMEFEKRTTKNSSVFNDFEELINGYNRNAPKKLLTHDEINTKYADMISQCFELIDETRNFGYAKKQMLDPTTLIKIFENVKRNLDSFKTINPNATIYGLGLYTPTKIKRSNVPYVAEFIKKYNSGYKQCIEENDGNYVDLSHLKIQDISTPTVLYKRQFWGIARNVVHDIVDEKRILCENNTNLSNNISHENIEIFIDKITDEIKHLEDRKHPSFIPRYEVREKNVGDKKLELKILCEVAKK